MAEETVTGGNAIKTRNSVGAGLTLVSTLGPTLGIPLPFWLRWVLFIAGVILIVWPAIRSTARRLVKMGIEPIHLQIIGLVGVVVFAALALGGVVWQMRLPGTDAKPNVSSEFDIFTGKQFVPAKATASPPPSAPSVPGLRRKYIGQSKILFDENLTQLSRILNGRGSEAVRVADKFLPLFAPGFASKMLDRYEPFNSNPQRVIEILDEMHESIWDKLLKENRDQAADLNDILVDGAPLATLRARLQRSIQYFNAFKIVVEKGDDDIRANSALLFSAQQKPTQDDVASFHDWIEACNLRLEQKRKALEDEK